MKDNKTTFWGPLEIVWCFEALSNDCESSVNDKWQFWCSIIKKAEQCNAWLPVWFFTKKYDLCKGSAYTSIYIKLEVYKNRRQELWLDNECLGSQWLWRSEAEDICGSGKCSCKNRSLSSTPRLLFGFEVMQPSGIFISLGLIFLHCKIER